MPVSEVLARLIDASAQITQEDAECMVNRIAREPEKVRLAMATALMGVGKRSAMLNAAALEVARATGPIAFTSVSGDCEPFDVVKHLTTDRRKAKLGITVQ